MSHLKRQEVPKRWPIVRKGTKYVVTPISEKNTGLPLLVILRDMLNIVQDRREAKIAVHLRQILINGKRAKDDKSGILLFDTVTIIPTKKSYRLELSDKGKYTLNEIKEAEAHRKIAKIVNRRTLKGKKIQLNLSDGRNFLSDIKCNINDSVVINMKEGKIEKCIPMKEKTKARVFAGKYSGKEGEIISLDLEEKTAKVKIDDKETNILIKQLMVVD